MRRQLTASAVPSLAAGLVLLAGGNAAARQPTPDQAVNGVAATEGGWPSWTDFLQQSDPSGLDGLQRPTGLLQVPSSSWLDSLLSRLRQSIVQQPIVGSAGQADATQGDTSK